MKMHVVVFSFLAVMVALKRGKDVDLSVGSIHFIRDNMNIDWLSSDQAEILACFLFSCFLWLATVLLRRYFLMGLLSYTGWMYEERGKVSRITKIWGFFIKALINPNARLFDLQQFLSYLPLPNLDDTIKRYLRTVRPLLDDQAYSALEAEANAFKKTHGYRFQWYLRLKWMLSWNYVSDWWEQFAYLKSRGPLCCNSNIYGLESDKSVSTHRQASRAGNCISLMLDFRDLVAKNQLKPIMIQGNIPLCNMQYTRPFNTTRVPGEVIDKTVHLAESKHLAVYSKGKWFKLDLYHNGLMLNAKEIEIQIQRILDDHGETSECERYLASLTAGNRTTWAQARQRYFSEGVNKDSLAVIEESVFVVSLDEDAYDAVNTEDDRKLDEYAKAMLHGDIYNRWFDKSFTLVVAKNARVGLNVEHSWADAPVTSHMWEYTIVDDYFKLGYDENGYTKGSPRFNDLPEPERLKWNFNYEVEQVIMASYDEALVVAKNTDLHIYVHKLFGKSEFKRCKTSPDAFIQMTLQLAYYKEFGQHDLTYESSMTRLFRHGRTETIRSCSIESCNWVKSMMDENATNAERLRLFKLATEYHQMQCRDAMAGRAVDRHLFCLYIVSNYLQENSPFLNQVLSQPWRLSTSQIAPTQANKVDLNKYPDLTPIGGGFGPVNEDGYGVSYVFCDDNTITFHISTKKSCDKTDAKRFGQMIKESLMCVKGLFDK